MKNRHHVLDTGTSPAEPDAPLEPPPPPKSDRARLADAADRLAAAIEKKASTS